MPNRFKDQHGRRREAAYARQRQANERAASAALEQASIPAANDALRRAESALTDRWGGANDALVRLRDIARQLAVLHEAERVLLRERDEAVAALRAVGMPWEQLTDRSGLSRQALSKRLPSG